MWKEGIEMAQTAYAPLSNDEDRTAPTQER